MSPQKNPISNKQIDFFPLWTYYFKKKLPNFLVHLMIVLFNYPLLENTMTIMADKGVSYVQSIYP